MEEKILLPAEAMSFLQLIKKYIILIPVIQRDYAQGRQTEEISKIREDFVHDLLFYIEDNSQPHYVDFVYGTVKHNSKHPDAFIPLDGQQRLTTLFLLHLYVAGMSDNYNKFYDLINGRFEYETRKSSTKFIKGIISHDVCGDLLKKREKNSETKPSMVIIRQGWFFEAWKQDPTVQGMLVMLDEIDHQVQARNCEVKTLYKNLFEGQIHPVVFQWQPLDGYTLTDDLYIKMNARGLKLTDFEVFKALYEMSLNRIQSDMKDEFEKKIDGEWCDFLWQRKGEVGSIDIVMERIMRLMIAFGFAGTTMGDKDSQTKLDKMFARNKQKLQFSYSRYGGLGVFHDTHVKNQEVGEELKNIENHVAKCVVEAFNIICDNNNSPLINANCEPWCDEKGLVMRILHGKLEDLTYDDLVFFYAYISFCSRYKGDLKEETKQWMRYIYNLTNATIIDGSLQLSRVVRSIDTMLESINNERVLCWIAKNDKVDAFSTNQSYEESVKAKLILWGEDDKHQEFRWKELIELNERDEYMRGQIGFLLVISGIYNVDIEDFDYDLSSKSLNVFEIYSEKARSIFSHFDKVDEMTTDHLLERALLTKGMYLKYATVGRLNFCNHPYDRDYSWRKMLEVTPGQDYSKGLVAMKDLLADDWVDNQNAICSLNTIINTYIEEKLDPSLWYSPFIGEFGVNLINICRQGYIQKNNEYVTLLHESQMNHYHSELQSRKLHCQLKPQYDFIHYYSVRSSEETPGLYFKIKVEGLIAAVYIWYNKDWYLKLYDEHMEVRMSDTQEWHSCKNKFEELLSRALADDTITINEDDLLNLLKRIKEKGIYCTEP